ncbi:FHA domain-containing protein, partial [Cellulomonas fimi]|uniref:FHA domain-containing protein n=1 Tax=Cellulomonas fimi TaxID=1708 RepID=UPI00234C47A1
GPGRSAAGTDAPPPPPLAPEPAGPTAPPPRPAFVDAPPVTAVVPVVPPSSGGTSGLVDVPAGLTGQHGDAPRTSGPVIDAVPGGGGASVPAADRPGLVQVPPTVTGAIPLVPVTRRPAPAPVDDLGDVEHTRLRDTGPTTPDLGDVERTRLRDAGPTTPDLGDVERTRLRDAGPITPDLGDLERTRLRDAAAPEQGLGNLEQTRLRDAGAPAQGLGDLEHTRLVATGDGTGRVPGTGVLRLVFDTGERVVVEGDGVVGRDPSDAGVAHVVAVDDPQRSVSKVHLAFGPEDGGRLWVVDRGSTNGTFLVAPDGAGSALAPGARAVVEAGWTIRFGQRAVRVEHV